MTAQAKRRSLFDPAIMRRAIVDAMRKLNPLYMVRNPVMFVVEVGGGPHDVPVYPRRCWDTRRKPAGLHPGHLAVAVVHGALCELRRGHGRRTRQSPGRYAAQDPPRRDRPETAGAASRWTPSRWCPPRSFAREISCWSRPATIIPGDGEVIEGVASVDESAITGESAPVIRECGGDRSAVTGGTRVLSDWLIVRVTANPGESFLDRMIAMVEGAKRQKTPNEIALNILLAALTIIFLLVSVTLLPFSIVQRQAPPVRARPVTRDGPGRAAGVPDPRPPSAGLLSAIGIAGMDRLIQANVIAMSGRAVEAAGDVDVLLLDKTGTITLGNRAGDGVHRRRRRIGRKHLADAAQLASLADETPEGRSIVVLAKEQYGLRGRGHA